MNTTSLRRIGRRRGGQAYPSLGGASGFTRTVSGSLQLDAYWAADTSEIAMPRVSQNCRSRRDGSRFSTV